LALGCDLRGGTHGLVYGESKLVLGA